MLNEYARQRLQALDSGRSSITAAALMEESQNNLLQHPETGKLKKWFSSLSVQDRITCLTTTFPFYVHSLIEAYQEMRETSVITQFRRILNPMSHHKLGQSAYSASSSSSRYPSYAQQQIKGSSSTSASMPGTSSSSLNSGSLLGLTGGIGSNCLPLVPQSIGQEFQLFEMIHSEESYFNTLSLQMMKNNHLELLSMISLTDYQHPHDTLTVHQKLVSEPTEFFDLMGRITSNRSFREPIMFSTKTGRVQIDQPPWLERIETSYLTVWIAGLLEENLWAHYNFANNVNIEKNVRKNELQNLFEARSDTLQSQEVLAKHWSDIGNKNKKKLIERLRQKAKEIEIVTSPYLHHSPLDFDLFNSIENREVGRSSVGLDDETNRYYASQIGSSLSNNIYNEEYNLQQILGLSTSSNQRDLHGLSQSQQMQLAHLNLYKPSYQFYQFNDLPVRPQYMKMHHELFSKDPNSAYSQSLAASQKSTSPSKNDKVGSSEGQSSKQKKQTGSKNKGQLGKGQASKDENDADLRNIVNYLTQKEPLVSSMDIIKFLSETPLSELSHFLMIGKARKSQLCREMLAIIQDDLRNTIQQQLMEDEFGSSSNPLSTNQNSVTGHSNNQVHKHHKADKEQHQTQIHDIGQKKYSKTSGGSTNQQIVEKEKKQNMQKSSQQVVKQTELDVVPQKGKKNQKALGNEDGDNQTNKLVENQANQNEQGTATAATTGGGGKRRRNKKKNNAQKQTDSPSKQLSKKTQDHELSTVQNNNAEEKRSSSCSNQQNSPKTHDKNDVPSKCLTQIETEDQILKKAKSYKLGNKPQLDADSKSQTTPGIVRDELGRQNKIMMHKMDSDDGKEVIGMMTSSTGEEEDTWTPWKNSITQWAQNESEPQGASTKDTYSHQIKETMLLQNQEDLNQEKEEESFANIHQLTASQSVDHIKSKPAYQALNQSKSSAAMISLEKQVANSTTKQFNSPQRWPHKQTSSQQNDNSITQTGQTPLNSINQFSRQAEPVSSTQQNQESPKKSLINSSNNQSISSTRQKKKKPSPPKVVGQQQAQILEFVSELLDKACELVSSSNSSSCQNSDKCRPSSNLISDNEQEKGETEKKEVSQEGAHVIQSDSSRNLNNLKEADSNRSQRDGHHAAVDADRSKVQVEQLGSEKTVCSGQMKEADGGKGNANLGEKQQNSKRFGEKEFNANGGLKLKAQKSQVDATNKSSVGQLAIKPKTSSETITEEMQETELSETFGSSCINGGDEEQTQNKKKRKRKKNNKPNDTAEAMNNFLRKMHGEDTVLSQPSADGNSGRFSHVSTNITATQSQSTQRVERKGQSKQQQKQTQPSFQKNNASAPEDSQKRGNQKQLQQTSQGSFKLQKEENKRDQQTTIEISQKQTSQNQGKKLGGSKPAVVETPSNVSIGKTLSELSKNTKDSKKTSRKNSEIQSPQRNDKSQQNIQKSTSLKQKQPKESDHTQAIKPNKDRRNAQRKKEEGEEEQKTSPLLNEQTQNQVENNSLKLDGVNIKVPKFEQQKNEKNQSSQPFKPNEKHSSSKQKQTSNSQTITEKERQGQGSNQNSKGPLATALFGQTVQDKEKIESKKAEIRAQFLSQLQSKELNAPNNIPKKKADDEKNDKRRNPQTSSQQSSIVAKKDQSQSQHVQGPTKGKDHIQVEKIESSSQNLSSSDKSKNEFEEQIKVRQYSSNDGLSSDIKSEVPDKKGNKESFDVSLNSQFSNSENPFLNLQASSFTPTLSKPSTNFGSASFSFQPAQPQKEFDNFGQVSQQSSSPFVPKLNNQGSSQLFGIQSDKIYEFNPGSTTNSNPFRQNSLIDSSPIKGQQNDTNFPFTQLKAQQSTFSDKKPFGYQPFNLNTSTVQQQFGGNASYKQMNTGENMQQSSVQFGKNMKIFDDSQSLSSEQEFKDFDPSSTFPQDKFIDDFQVQNSSQGSFNAFGQSQVGKKKQFSKKPSGSSAAHSPGRPIKQQQPFQSSQYVEGFEQRPNQFGLNQQNSKQHAGAFGPGSTSHEFVSQHQSADQFESQQPWFNSNQAFNSQDAQHFMPLSSVTQGGTQSTSPLTKLYEVSDGKHKQKGVYQGGANLYEDIKRKPTNHLGLTKINSVSTNPAASASDKNVEDEKGLLKRNGSAFTPNSSNKGSAGLSNVKKGDRASKQSPNLSGASESSSHMSGGGIGTFQNLKSTASGALEWQLSPRLDQTSTALRQQRTQPEYHSPMQNFQYNQDSSHFTYNRGDQDASTQQHHSLRMNLSEGFGFVPTARQDQVCSNFMQKTNNDNLNQVHQSQQSHHLNIWAEEGRTQNSFSVPSNASSYNQGFQKDHQHAQQTQVEAQQMQNLLQYKVVEDQFYEAFDVQIKEHVAKLQRKIGRFDKEREYVHSKIEQMAQKVLDCPNLVVKIFGSLVTGLALESSDMDMAITGLKISDRNTLIEDLHDLEQALREWDLIFDLKSIDTASIPVIKAKIDLMKIRKLLRDQNPNTDTTKIVSKDSQTAREEVTDKQTQIQIEESGEDESTWISETEVILPIDITFDDSQQDTNQSFGGINQHKNGFDINFGNMLMGGRGNEFGLGIMENIGNFLGQPNFNIGAPKDVFSGPTTTTKTHLGIASCNLLKDYVMNYPCLKEVGILMKQFLQLHDFNSAYRGGISSYSAILLIVAYMNNFKLHQSPHITPSRLLMGFLEFYSKFFDHKRYGINTLNDMSFYQLPMQSQQYFVIVDPVNPSNNTARSSHRTPEILQMFNQAFTQLKSLIQQQLENSQKRSQLSSEILASQALDAEDQSGLLKQEKVSAVKSGKDHLGKDSSKQNASRQERSAKDEHGGLGEGGEASCSASGETPRPHLEEEESKCASRMKDKFDGASPLSGHKTATPSLEQQQLTVVSGLMPTEGESFSQTNAFTSLSSSPEKQGSQQPLSEPIICGPEIQQQLSAATGTLDGGQLSQQREMAQLNSENLFGQNLIAVFLSTDYSAVSDLDAKPQKDKVI